MIATIIYLIIIGLIVRKVLMDKKSKTHRPQRNQSDARQAYQSQAQTDFQKQQQMRELKHRLEQKYKSAPPPTQAKQKGTYSRNMNYKNKKEDASILQKAKANTAENDADAMKEADKKWHETAHAKHMSDTWEETDILKQVYDLMAVGYSGNLNYERDFLSEGMDMINRIGMIDNNLETINYNSGIADIRKQV